MDRTAHCAHPGCNGAVAAVLGYDYANRTAWLDRPATEGGWGLCEQHSADMHVPLGWALVDRRKPTLYVAAS
jgi:hypothetical protein